MTQASENQLQAPTNIWMLAREYEGLAGAGGVKDVVRQLAEALARSGRKISVVLPRYGFLDPLQHGFSPLDQTAIAVDMNYTEEIRQEPVLVFYRRENLVGGGSLSLYLLDAARYREKHGVYTYTEEEEALSPFNRKGAGHYDYFAMNVLLEKAAAHLMMRLDECPEIVHCHDGHAALLPVMIRELPEFRSYFADTACLVTIHNAGIGYHQEVGDLPFAEAVTGLAAKTIADNLLEGSFDPFLAASSYAVMNAVSENYARELRETSDDALTGLLGHRLLARGVILRGVTNGINPADFDPKQPAKLGLAAAFDPASGELAGKALCRESLLAALARGLDLPGVRQSGLLAQRANTPLFTFVGRLSSQKGVDVLIEALAPILRDDRDFQVLIQGSGSQEIETALISLTEAPENHGRVCLLRGYDPLLANRVYAAGDFFLIPSRYEPCGLTDYIAQLFGNLPVVHHVGGLVKVVDGETGFAYHEHSPYGLSGAMERATRLYRQNPARIRQMQQAAVRVIREQYTWDKVLLRYLALYQEAMALDSQTTKHR